MTDTAPLPPAANGPAPRSAWARALVAVCTLLLAGLLCVAIAATLLYQRQPDLHALVDYRPAQPLRIFTSDGIEIAQFGSERRHLLSIDRIPKRMQEAVLAVEDRRFRDHFGVDARGVIRAVVTNLWEARRSQGGSTITQQVARAFYLTSRKTYARKINEMLLAVKIERQFSKDQVLELYMNQIYLGQRAYGFEAAAHTYFGKSLGELSLAETAMLAGLPQNPVHANPVVNFKRAVQRQLVVLDRMVAAGVATPAERDQAAAETLHIRQDRDSGLGAAYVAEMVRQRMVERFGEQAYTMGLQVFTSVRSTDQKIANEALRHGVLDHARRQAHRGPEDHETWPTGAVPGAPEVVQLLAEHRDDPDLRVALVSEASRQRVVVTLAAGEVITLEGEGLRQAMPALSGRPGVRQISAGSVIRVAQDLPSGDWAIRQWPDTEGSLVSLDPDTGRVLALVGGFDFQRNQFNHATQAWRQPGSVFKPFLFSAALEHGVMPATLINDAPYTLRPAGGGPAWTPQNADGRHDGAVSLRQALAQSKNLVTVRLVKLLGPELTREWIARFGFEPSQHPASLSLALGTGSVTPLQVASAYAVLANGGHRVPPVLIERVTDAVGNVLFESTEPVLSEPVLPYRNVFITNSMLNEVTRTGTAAQVQDQLKRSDLYGKTGTTDQAADAWFAGFQRHVVTVVWMGHDQNRSLGAGESGGSLALPVWLAYMQHALHDLPLHVPEVPDDVIQVRDDWVYIEWAFGGQVTELGFDERIPAAPVPPTAEDDPAKAASAVAP